MKSNLKSKKIVAVQFIKYSIAGGIATGVHILMFFLCAWIIFPALTDKDFLVKLFNIPVIQMSDALRARNSMIDNGLAFIFSNSTAYIINIFWVFESGRHHRIIEIGLFFLVSGISMAVGTPLMGVLIRYLGITTTVAFAANIIVAVLINFLMRKFVIFKG